MKKRFNKTVNVDLTAVDGNAFAIMGAFRRQAVREGWSQEDISLVLADAKSGDYDHLITTIMAYCEDDDTHENTDTSWEQEA